MERAIVHLNVADFAVAVERIVDRRLMGRPVIIAPPTSARARVYDMSEEAYREGVRKQMPLAQARRLCPQARLRPPRPGLYQRAMHELLGKALAFSPLVEPGYADGHLFVDLSGTSRLLGPPVDAAWKLQRRIRTDLDLDPIWTLATNKLVAKVASRLVKPSGEYIVAAGDEEAFLAPLPLALLPGLEGDDLERLARLNLTRAGQVAGLTPEQLEVAVGGRAGSIAAAARGLDHEPVLPAGSPGALAPVTHMFAADTACPGKIRAALLEMVQETGRRLRRGKLAAGGLVLAITYSDGVRCIRRKACRPATANDLDLFELACRVLELAWTRRVRVRGLRLACWKLRPFSLTLPLFAVERRHVLRRHNLVTALDRIRDRFGKEAVCFGRSLAAAP